MAETKPRYHIIDILRGLAVLLMIIFHFTYDLALFKFVTLTFKKHQDPFWWFLPRIIVFLFMLSMGMSLHLVHHPKMRWTDFWMRFAKLAFWAIIISISTYYLFPKRWIYFGTLHSIAICSILAIPLLFIHKYINLAIGLSLLGHSIITGKSIPFWMLKHASMDYIPPFPWIGAVAIGIFLVKQNMHVISIPDQLFLRILRYLGKYSLRIYLLHQPILYGLVYLFNRLTS